MNSRMNRRKFLKTNATAAIAAAGYSFLPNFLYGSEDSGGHKSYAEYLKNSAVPKEELDIFLNENSWAQFDPEVGYILGNYMPHDGIDHSFTL